MRLASAAIARVAAAITATIVQAAALLPHCCFPLLLRAGKALLLWPQRKYSTALAPQAA